MEWIEDLIPVRRSGSRSLIGSQTLAVPSSLPVTIHLPSGEIAADQIEPRWPLSVLTSLPVVPSQTLAVRSLLPVRIHCCEKAIELIQWPCPSRVSSSLPLATSHILPFPSPVPVTIRRPSGEKATPFTEPQCPLIVCS